MIYPKPLDNMRDAGSSAYVWRCRYPVRDLPWFRADEEIVEMMPNPMLLRVSLKIDMSGFVKACEQSIESLKAFADAVAKAFSQFRGFGAARAARS